MLGGLEHLKTDRDEVVYCESIKRDEVDEVVYYESIHEISRFDE